MEIFPKDSLPVPEGWWRRRRRGEMKTMDIERRTRERDIRDREQKKGGRRKRGEKSRRGSLGETDQP